MMQLSHRDPMLLDIFFYLLTYDYSKVDDLPEEQSDRVRWAIQQYNMLYQRNFEPEETAKKFHEWKEENNIDSRGGFDLQVTSI